jgi:neogenin
LFLIFSETNSEYVISVRAYNQMGDGQPVYESVRTKQEQTLKVSAPLLPPVGLEAVVLSGQSVVVYWTDSQLAKTQVHNKFLIEAHLLLKKFQH